jgi:hypothetical protein
MINVHGFADLTRCAQACITFGGPYDIDKTTGCHTTKCICQPSTFAIALASLKKCISVDEDEPGWGPVGCGEDSQQEPAATVLKVACSDKGFNVDDVSAADPSKTSGGSAHTTAQTAGETPVETGGTGAGTGTTVSTAAGIERGCLGMFAVVVFVAVVATMALPALLFRVNV